MLGQDKYTISIPKNKPVTEDYQALKELGIQYIQALSKNVWTDFNPGDPGVTILESLCYALTDLAYRTQLPLEDLLTEEDQDSPFGLRNSFTAREILTYHPLTISDYRKLILDKFPEVRNVWLYPIRQTIEPQIFIHKNKKQLTLDTNQSFQQQTILLNGLYNVKVETIKKDAGILNKIKYLLNAHRNLCEDFHCVDLVDFEFVTTCMDIDIDGTVPPEKVKEEIYRRIYDYCSPQLKRYSLKQMLAKGYSVTDIFNGPDITNGFFDAKELENFEKRNVLYVSDLINSLMDIPGVKNIRKIHLNSYESRNGIADFDLELRKDEEYCLHLNDLEKAFRFFIDTKDQKGNKINFYYDGLKLYQPELVEEEKLIPKQNQLPSIEEEWFRVISRYRNIKPYYSIQNEFPKTYMLGQEGITDMESEERHVQRLQLKGFLLHFEQLMADYTAQLHHVKKMYSWSSDADYRSYLYQSLNEEEINDLKKLTTLPDLKDSKLNLTEEQEVEIKKLKEEGKLDRYNELFDDITNDATNDDYYEQVLHISPDKNFDRRNRFLNHLIARFNDSFVEFSIVEFFKKNNKTYRKHSIIADKKSFLRTYPQLSANRLKAFDYKQEIWNTPNISGYEMRVAKKLGLTNYITSNPDLIMRHSLVHPVLNLENINENNLTTFYNYNDVDFDRQFGFHLIEHQLLRPSSAKDEVLPICNDNAEDLLNCYCKDPYSFRMTIVLPGWLPITLNEGFRTYVESVFREELPAHIALKMCWVSPLKMLEFEKNYFQFMKQLETKKTQNCTKIPKIKNAKLSALLHTLSTLENVYYPSHLVDCEEIDFDFLTNETTKHPTILNQTALNSKLTFDVNWVNPKPELWETYAELPNLIQYQESENDIKFFLNEKEIKLQTINLLKLNFVKNADETGKIVFSNGESLETHFTENGSMVTSFKLENKEDSEWDLIWCQWNGTELNFNLNKKVQFKIELKKLTQTNTDFNIELKNLDNTKSIYKIKEAIQKPDFKQHDWEKIWLEIQNDPNYSIDPVKELPLSELLIKFVKEVKKRKIKQNRQNKPSK